MAVDVQNNVETDVWLDIEIICPVCRTKKSINIPARIIDKSKQLTSILIPIGRICDHAFIPFVDKQFKVRGYQKLDALLEDIESKPEPIIGLTLDDIDVIGIKMNLKPNMIMYTLRGVFFKKKVLILIDKNIEYLKDNLSNYFEYIFQRSFDTDILIQLKGEYKKNKQFYSDYLILEGKDIIGKTKNSFKIESLKIESELIKDFYREGDSVLGLKNLGDKLREIHALSYKLFEFYNKQNKDQPLQIKKTMRYLEDTHFTRIRKDYFLLLIDVVKNYFDTNIQLVQEKIGNMIDQMWGG